jgi:hypothetical protein
MLAAMSDTSSHLPVCVYCGTPRPADETSCPKCGKGWIDVRIGNDEPASPTPPDEVVPAVEPPPSASTPPDAADQDSHIAAGVVPATAATLPPPPSRPGTSALDDTGEFSFDDWTLPPDKPRSMARWLIPLILLVAVVVVWALVFIDGSTAPTTTIAAETTTTEVTTTTTATTTTATTSTTVADTTTTTIAVPPPSTWEPVGEPIPTNELTLRASGIGPIETGTPIAEAAGRLTASLGEASAATIEGLCPPEESYALQWDELSAIFDGFGSDATFVSYRFGGPDSTQLLGLTTLSGLALGDTVADLERIYAQFTIAFEVIDGVDHFRLVDGGELLLWGPVTGTDQDDLIEGIYSPSPCDEA